MKTGNDAHGDQEIVTGIILGEKENFGKLYRKYFQKVYYRCLSMTRSQDEAFDLAQDILLKAYDHLNDYRGDASFSTWLYAITHNHCIEYYRKKNLRHFVDLEQASRLAGSESEPGEPDITQEMLDRLNLSMDSMPLSDKELLALRYEQNLSIKDLQEKLKLSPSGVKMRLFRARKKLADCALKPSLRAGVMG